MRATAGPDVTNRMCIHWDVGNDPKMRKLVIAALCYGRVDIADVLLHHVHVQVDDIENVPARALWTWKHSWMSYVTTYNYIAAKHPELATWIDRLNAMTDVRTNMDDDETENTAIVVSTLAHVAQSDQKRKKEQCA